MVLDGDGSAQSAAQRPIVARHLLRGDSLIFDAIGGTLHDQPADRSPFKTFGTVAHANVRLKALLGPRRAEMKASGHAPA